LKNENEFNSFLSKELIKLRPDVYTLKTSQRFHAGISDFLIWWHRNGVPTSAALETKFVKELPKRNGKVLQHPFGGAQRTFMKNIQLSKNAAFGGIGVKSEKLLYIIPCSLIPKEGNWQGNDFQELKKEIQSVPFNDISRLIPVLERGIIDVEELT
jgi:hypothetical protein